MKVGNIRIEEMEMVRNKVVVLNVDRNKIIQILKDKEIEIKDCNNVNDYPLF